MKRFLLFAYSHHGANGGMFDLKGSFETSEAAIGFFYSKNEKGYDEFDLGHYFDLETNEIHQIK